MEPVTVLDVLLEAHRALSGLTEKFITGGYEKIEPARERGVKALQSVRAAAQSIAGAKAVGVEPHIKLY